MHVVCKAQHNASKTGRVERLAQRDKKALPTTTRVARQSGTQRPKGGID